MKLRNTTIASVLSAMILIGFIHRAAGAELLYKEIAHSPPTGYVAPKIGCLPGFGQPWNDPAQGMNMRLGYYQGQLIAQQFVLAQEDVRAKKNWNDLKLVKGAPIERITFGQGRGGEPNYFMLVYYVDRETVRKVCPSG